MSNKDWKKVKLGDICTIKTGKLNANAAVENGEYAFFTCSRETFRTDRYSFDGEALLIAGNGDVGFTKYYVGKFDAYQRTYVLMDFCVDARYIYFYLQKYLPARIEAEMMGSAVPYIKLGTLSDMEIQVPNSIEEQRRIASLLSRFDELIQLHEFKADNLIKAKQQLMSDIFSGGLRELESINPDAYVQDNWVTVKLGDIGKLTMGSTPSTKVAEYYGGDRLWITPSDIVKGNKYVFETERKLTDLGWSEARHIPANSILITCIASIGKNCIATEEVSCNQQIIALTPNSEYDTDYLYYAICSIEHNLHALAGKATVEIVNKTKLAGVEIKIPPTLEEQKKIANLLSSYDSLIELKQSQKQQVTNMKQQLMSQLLTNGGGRAVG